MNKLGPTVAAEKVSGIPFRLTKPHFTLTATSPAEGAKKKLTYTLAVSYEPDATQSYTLQFDPAMFVDPTFGMKFGAGSTLTSVNGSATDQIGPTITAISSFTASLLGSAAALAFDEGDVRSAIKDAMAEEQQSGAPKCTSGVADEIVNRMDAFEDDDSFAGQFYYFDDAEKECLDATLTLMEKGGEESANRAKEAFEKAKETHLTNFPEDKLWIARLNRAVDDNDSKEFEALLDEDETGPRAASRKNVLAEGRDAASAAVASKAQKVLEVIVKLSSPAWRARHLIRLEKEIEALNRQLLMASGDDEAAGKKNEAVIETLRKRIDYLRKQRAQALDRPGLSATALYERQLVLEGFLEKIERRQFRNGGSSPALKEYSTARTELDEIVKQLEALRAVLLSEAKPVEPTLNPFPVTPVKLVPPEFVKEPIDEKSPQYVVVLKEIQ